MSNEAIFEHNRRTEEESLIQRQFKASEKCQTKLSLNITEEQKRNP